MTCRPRPPRCSGSTEGGLIFGSPEQDDRNNAAFARELGITVAAVRYRFASTSPAPAAVEDTYAGLRGLVAQADELHIDPERIAIGGASAGGALTAALAQLAHDRGEIRPAFQLLVYPMLGDSGVPCELHVVPGAFHGFDLVFPGAEVSRQFWRLQARALNGALAVAP